VDSNDGNDANDGSLENINDGKMNNSTSLNLEFFAERFELNDDFHEINNQSDLEYFLSMNCFTTSFL